MGWNDLIYEKLSEKWSEEMPVLYEMSIFLQDELIETLIQEGKFENDPVEGGVIIKNITFNSMQDSVACLNASNKAYRRQFDEE